MNKLILATFFALGGSAFAHQTVTCYWTSGFGGIKAVLKTNANGSLNARKSQIQVDGFTRKDKSSLLSSLAVNGLNQSKVGDSSPYAILFINDAEEMLDVQLQFERKILSHSFENVPARFVVGSDDANPETSFATGYNVLCDSELR